MNTAISIQASGALLKSNRVTKTILLYYFNRIRKNYSSLTFIQKCSLLTFSKKDKEDFYFEKTAFGIIARCADWFRTFRSLCSLDLYLQRIDGCRNHS